MVVKEVESLKTRLIELFGEGGSYVGVLHLLPEEDHGGQHECGREEQEDEGRPSQPLPRHVLHHQVEGEVHAHVDEEEEEQHRGELYVGHEEETTTEESVDCHEPDQKTQPTHNHQQKKSGREDSYKNVISWAQASKTWRVNGHLEKKHLVFDLNSVFAFSLICITILGTQRPNMKPQLHINVQP